jgi:TorA maturation chaperone TorD
MNEFSLLCRMSGNLFYRSPDDPILAPLMSVIRAGKLAEAWPLEQDQILCGLQKEQDLTTLVADYQQLFDPKGAKVSPYANDWQPNITAQAIVNFLSARGRVVEAAEACHFGQILLSASWLEDNRAGDENSALIELFENYLQTWYGTFLGKMEGCANTEFYRSLARLARGAIQAMYDELMEADAQ